MRGACLRKSVQVSNLLATNYHNVVLCVETAAESNNLDTITLENIPSSQKLYEVCSVSFVSVKDSFPVIANRCLYVS